MLIGISRHIGGVGRDFSMVRLVHMTQHNSANVVNKAYDIHKEAATAILMSCASYRPMTSSLSSFFRFMGRDEMLQIIAYTFFNCHSF
ncbi:High frequency lysogenization protein HflD [Dirofilaria immitis]